MSNSKLPVDWLSRPAFWRAYLQWDLDLSEEGHDEEAEWAYWAEHGHAPPGAKSTIEREGDAQNTLDRLFAARDSAIEARLFPRLVPPDVIDDADLAAARTLLKDDAATFDRQPYCQILENVAARRRLPPNAFFELDFEGGYRWKVEFDPAPAIDHTLHHAELGAPLSLGTRDAHFTLPILRWEEVRSLGSRLGVRERLLLCSTAFVGPDDDKAEIALWLGSWWRMGELTPDETVDEIVRRLLYTTTVRWTKGRAGGFTNDGEHSHRNPKNRGWSKNDHQRMRTFLEAGSAPERPETKRRGNGH